MAARIDSIPEGTVTSPEGFFAGATGAGINKKAKNKPDLGILFSDSVCVVAGVFTTNRIKAAPVLLSQERLKRGRARAVVVNSGCANACTGGRGLEDAARMAELAAKGVGIAPEEVLVASTGVIGVPLPMEKITPAIERIVLSREGGHELAKAIMTTDTFAKEIAVRVKDGDSQFIIGGVAKGAGMIHPNLATLLGFITTDAALELDFARDALKRAVDISFNMLSIDGDTSPNDTVLLLANGRAGRVPPDVFEMALIRVCIYLAKCIARDGEGASKLIEVTIEGARDQAQARLAARTIVSSPLVKAAVHGADPNWGRVMAALGRSGAEVEEARIDLYLGEVQLLKAGTPLAFSEPEVIKLLKAKEVIFRLNLNLGSASATAWGCDLSEEYVTINSQYMT